MPSPILHKRLVPKRLKSRETPGANMAPDSHEAQQANDELDYGITLPVNVRIEVDHTVYDLS
jgi:hypothetical protein